MFITSETEIHFKKISEEAFWSPYFKVCILALQNAAQAFFHVLAVTGGTHTLSMGQKCFQSC